MSLFHDDDYSGNNHFGDGYNPHRTPHRYCDHPPSSHSKRTAQRHSAPPSTRKATPIDDKKVAPRYNNVSRKKEGGEIIDLLLAALRVKQRFNKKDPPSP